jgi:Zn-dependent metalloprotease
MIENEDWQIGEDVVVERFSLGALRSIRIRITAGQAEDRISAKI